MIGIDIIEIGRVKKAAQNPRFLSRVFTPAERAYIESKQNAPQTIAGLFAAKEAVAKALGSGFSGGLGHLDIEITHTGAGAPAVALSGVYAAAGQIALSISHCEAYAAATALRVNNPL